MRTLKSERSSYELYDRSWLMQARLKAGLRQEDVAKACGIATGTYCKIERGISLPNVRMALLITDAIGVDVRNFLSERRLA